MLALRDSERAEMLSGAAALARRVLLDPDPEPAPDLFHAAVHGLYWLAVELAADRPVLLVVDDAHWADAGGAFHDHGAATPGAGAVTGCTEFAQLPFAFNQTLG